jgi:ribonuclease Z
MGLIFTMHLQKRANDLHVYSHRGLDEIITTQLRYSRSAPTFRIHYHRLEKGARETIYDDDALTVETIPLSHKIRCSGFLFREKIKPRRIDKSRLPEGLLVQQIAGLKTGADVIDEHGTVRYRNADLTFDPRKSRTYAYCSDTAFDPGLVPQITQVDLLYHEATFLSDDERKAVETMHSTARQAAAIAQMAGAGSLLLGHFSARYKDLNVLLEEARTIFPNSKLAVEGDEHSIDD